MAHATPLSRRSLLAISAAAAAGTTVAASLPALAQPNPDAELLRLDREHDVAFARALAYGASTDRWDDKEFNEICGAYTALEFAIHHTPAQTLAGLAVKARIAAEYAAPANPEEPLLDDIFDSLILDILRLTNVRPKRFLFSNTLGREGQSDGTV